MKVWGFYKGTGHLPHRAEVRGALDKVGYTGTSCSTATNQTVRFASNGVEIDPGGIGKGYAVDHMAGRSEGRTASTRRWSPAAAAASTPWALPRENRGWKVNIKRSQEHLEIGRDRRI